MEIQLKSISYEAGKYDVRKSVELVLHGPDGEGSDLWDPNDREYKGRKFNFKVVMGESPIGRLHDGTAILRATTKLGERLLQWKKNHNIIVCRRPLRIFNNHQKVPRDVKQTLEKARYIDSEQDRRVPMGLINQSRCVSSRRHSLTSKLSKRSSDKSLPLRPLLHAGLEGSQHRLLCQEN